MPKAASPPPKPRSEVLRSELVQLPQRTAWRRFVRFMIRQLLRLLVWIFTRTEVVGLENVPRQGAALLVSNHLGDADVIVGMSFAPVDIEVMSKIELYDLPFWGKLMQAYGVIWVHRGQPDRRALRAALEGLEQGRLLALAPEGRESVTGALEKGTGGAAYLALKAGVPVLPVAFTGTENTHIYGNIKRLRRSRVTITIGSLFNLESSSNRRDAIEAGTRQIMNKLAELLPPEYRGVYQDAALS